MLYQPIYDETSPEGLVFFTGNPDHFFSTHPILQEACKRIDRMITNHSKTRVTRFRLPVSRRCKPETYEEHVVSYFNLLRSHADMFELDFHYVCAKEHTQDRGSLYHVLVLVSDDTPLKNTDFIRTVESAWGWVTKTRSIDLDTWCYGNDKGGIEPNLLVLEHPSPTASDKERLSQEGYFRAGFGLCLEWAQQLAEVGMKHGVAEWGASTIR